MTNQTVKTLLQDPNSSKFMQIFVSSILALFLLAISESSLGAESRINKICQAASIVEIKNLINQNKDNYLNTTDGNSEIIKLSKKCRQNIISALVKLVLEDQDQKVRELSGAVLSEIGGIEATNTLMKTLEKSDESIELRKAAAIALGKMGKTGIDILRKAMQDSDSETQYIAIWGVAALAQDDDSLALKILESNKEDIFKIVDEYEKNQINSTTNEPADSKYFVRGVPDSSLSSEVLREENSTPEVKMQFMINKLSESAERFIGKVWTTVNPTEIQQRFRPNNPFPRTPIICQWKWFKKHWRWCR